MTEQRWERISLEDKEIVWQHKLSRLIVTIRHECVPWIRKEFLKRHPNVLGKQNTWNVHINAPPDVMQVKPFVTRAEAIKEALVIMGNIDRIWHNTGK